MADIKIDLEAVSGEFVKSIQRAQKEVNKLSAQMEALRIDAKKMSSGMDDAATAAKKYSSAAGSASTLKLATAIGLAVTAFNALYDAAKRATGAIVDTFKAGIQNIDDFKRVTIGSAAAITNLADQSANAGRTYDEIFNQNLRATEQIFVELEKLAARYFASSTDLQLAYNTFAQRGIVIRRNELELLAQLTDQILLLTSGQQSNIQIQEEIRSLVNGNLRTTAQLSQLIKAYGLDVKEVASQIRATGSLNPLAEVLKGARAATTAIQKTYTAAFNGLETAIRQIGRLGLEQLYIQLVSGVQRFTDALNRNRVAIVQVFAVIGKASGDILESVTKAVTALFGLDKQTTRVTSGYISFIAGVETAIQVIIRSVQVLINLLTELPEILSLVGQSIEIDLSTDPMVKDLKRTRAIIEDEIKIAEAQFKEFQNRGFKAGDAQFDAAQTRLFLAKSTLSEINTEIFQLEKPFANLTKVAQSFITTLSGGAGKTLDVLKEHITVGDKLQKVFDKVNAAIAPLANFNIRGAFAGNRQELLGAAAVAGATTENLLNTPEVANAPTRTPFVLDPKDLQEIEHLTKAVVSAQDRYNRALRTASQTEIAGKIETQLEGLRRDLTLTQAGLDHFQGRVFGIRSVVLDAFNFVGRNIKSFVFGLNADVSPLIDAVSNTTESILGNVYSNLKQQYDTAVQGLENFKKVARQASIELHRTEVDPHLDAATRLASQAEADFAVAVKNANDLVKAAEAEVEAAEKRGDVLGTVNAQTRLFSEQNARDNTIRLAQNTRLIEQHKADLEFQIAIANRAKIDAQEANAVAVEQTKLEKERLRILQAQEQVIGNILRKNADNLRDAQQRLISAQRQAPRTDLEAGAAEIEDVRVAFSLKLGEAVGELKVMENQLNDLAGTAEGLDQNLITNVINQKAYIAELQKTAEELIKQLEFNNAYRVSFEAIANATRNTILGLADALLQAFEGKKTDFARLGKSIADQLFKDSLTNVIQSATKFLQTSFTDMFKSLDISDSMAKTLGPAFLAGFALIASLILSQFLGDKGGSATAGNPTVGIQSTEQVRGLIGGETQIPIGQIAESLQDALVPTNLLLARIANGVERLTAAGLSSAQIEAVIAQSLNDALQIQSV